ncbi:MAG: hypothetical protein V4592_22450, partial [Bacteroidota bacterium]
TLFPLSGEAEERVVERSNDRVSLTLVGLHASFLAVTKGRSKPQESGFNPKFALLLLPLCIYKTYSPLMAQ